MKIAIERIFTSKLRQNAAIEPIFSTFIRDAPSPHITFRDGRSVPPPLVLKVKQKNPTVLMCEV